MGGIRKTRYDNLKIILKILKAPMITYVIRRPLTK